MNAFGIVSVALTIAFNLPDEVSLLVVGGSAGAVEDDVAVGHLVAPFTIHEFLLAIDLVNHEKALVFVTAQENELGSAPELSGDAFEIAPEITHLLADGFVNFLPLRFLLFGNC